MALLYLCKSFDDSLENCEGNAMRATLGHQEKILPRIKNIEKRWKCWRTHAKKFSSVRTPIKVSGMIGVNCFIKHEQSPHCMGHAPASCPDFFCHQWWCHTPSKVLISLGGRWLTFQKCAPQRCGGFKAHVSMPRFTMVAVGNLIAIAVCTMPIRFSA